MEWSLSEESKQDSLGLEAPVRMQVIQRLVAGCKMVCFIRSDRRTMSCSISSYRRRWPLLARARASRRVAVAMLRGLRQVYILRASA